METLTWKDSHIAESFSDCENLSDIVRVIEKQNKTQGKVICRITVNGMPFTEVDEERFSTSPVREIQTLDVELIAIRQLVDETDVSTQQYAKGLVEPAICVAEGFRGKDLNGAHTLFKSLLESVESLLQASELSAAVRRQENAPLSPAFESLNKRIILLLNQILQAYEKRDFILTADLLEYELTQAFSDLVKALEENIDSSRQQRENHSVG